MVILLWFDGEMKHRPVSSQAMGGILGLCPAGINGADYISLLHKLK